MSRLRLLPEQRATLRRRLASLVEAGELIKVRGNRYGLPDRMRLVTGRVQVHPRGFGFVTPDQPITGIDGDLFIAGTNLNQAHAWAIGWWRVSSIVAVMVAARGGSCGSSSERRQTWSVGSTSTNRAWPTSFRLTGVS